MRRVEIYAHSPPPLHSEAAHYMSVYQISECWAQSDPLRALSEQRM
jgi:hypothetical protein